MRLAVFLILVASCHTAAPPVTSRARVASPPTPRAVAMPEAARPAPASALLAVPVPGDARDAIATIRPVPGHHVRGVVRFRATETGVYVTAELDNMPGTHVYRVHASSNCRDHGPADTELGELRDNGKLTTKHVTFVGGARLGGAEPWIGRTVVVEWAPDNEFIPPARRVARPVACGVIEIPR